MSREYYKANKAKWRGYYDTRRHKAPLYAAWRSILIRTGRKPGAKPHEVKDYIDRGIDLYDPWMDYFIFESWCFNNGWKSGLQIDRIDNNRGYHPDNCRFVTRSQNQRNRRNNHWYEYHGSRVRLIDAYEKSGSTIDYKKVFNRVVRLKWDLDRAFTTR